jgi:hypothetical protein
MTFRKNRRGAGYPRCNDRQLDGNLPAIKSVIKT